MPPATDLEAHLLTISDVGVFAIISAESGCFFGFLLPGTGELPVLDEPLPTEPTHRGRLGQHHACR